MAIDPATNSLWHCDPFIEHTHIPWNAFDTIKFEEFYFVCRAETASAILLSGLHLSNVKMGYLINKVEPF